MLLYEPALRYYLAVFDLGSISAAARELDVAASAVSRQISRLERHLGTALFDRAAGGMRATAAGREFNDFVRRVLRDTDQLTSRFAHAAPPAAPVTLAASFGVAQTFLPTVLAEYSVRHPTARFTVTVAPADEVGRLVRDGRADIALTFSLRAEPGLKLLCAVPAPMKALARSGHPLAARSSITVSEMADHPLALTPLGTNSRQLFEIALANAGRSCVPVLESEHPGVLTQFIRHTDAMTVLSHVAFPGDLGSAGIAAITLQNPEFQQRSLRMQAPPGTELTGSVRSLAEHLVEHLERTAVSP